MVNKYIGDKKFYDELTGNEDEIEIRQIMNVLKSILQQ